MTLKINHLHAIIKETGEEILKGVNLTVPTGEIHAIMGPNGTGKSTLSETIMGYPAYEVTQGTVEFDGQDVLSLPVNERRTAINAQRPEDDPLPVLQFIQRLQENMALLEMPDDITDRYLNVGFSGGEKKRNEVLQMLMLQPKLAILDEIDSGLDIDALRIVAKGINHLRGPEFSALLITHYERLLEYVTPDKIHVMVDGQIVKTAGPELADELEADGYAKYEQIRRNGVSESTTPE